MMMLSVLGSSPMGLFKHVADQASDRRGVCVARSTGHVAAHSLLCAPWPLTLPTAVDSLLLKAESVQRFTSDSAPRTSVPLEKLRPHSHEETMTVGPGVGGGLEMETKCEFHRTRVGRAGYLTEVSGAPLR